MPSFRSPRLGERATEIRTHTMSTPPLFRPEATQAQTTQWLGSIRIGRPLSFSLVTGAALLMAAGLASFAVFGEYTRKVSLPGVLVPEGGVMDIASPQGGTVVEVLVKEGDEVAAGQPLIRLRAERQVAGGELGQLQAAAVAQRRMGLETELRLLDQQAQQRGVALSDRLRSLQSDQVNLLGELEAVQQRVALATKTVKDFDELATKGFVPQLQAQQKREELLDLEQRERNARRQLEAAQRELDSVQAELAMSRTQVESSRAQLQRQLVTLSQEGSELDGRSAWTLTAPRAGKVAVMSAVAGQAVTAGLNLAALLPSGAQAGEGLVAHLYAPSRTAGFIEPGQKVQLRYSAFPYQKFGMHYGEVTAVSRTPVNPQDLPSGRAQGLMQAAHATEPLYRIQVRLAKQALLVHGEKRVLRAGITLESQVQQDHRSILEWAFDPLIFASNQ